MVEASGRAAMGALKKNIRPRDVVTREALDNAATVVAATGGSTNAGLHLPAIANEAGIRYTLDDVAKIFKRTPYIADLMPGGKHTARAMYEAGGVGVVIKELLDAGLLEGDCPTVTGRTLAQNYAKVRFPKDQDVFYRVSEALSPTGGVVGLKGNLAPEGAIVKVAPASPGCISRGRRGCSTARRTPSMPWSIAGSRRARSSSSATRVRAAGRACARCCRPPPRSTGSAWARAWR